MPLPSSEHPLHYASTVLSAGSTPRGSPLPQAHSPPVLAFGPAPLTQGQPLSFVLQEDPRAVGFRGEQANFHPRPSCPFSLTIPSPRGPARQPLILCHLTQAPP